VERQRILEHLAWRRAAIPAKCEGVVERFHQEYPSTAAEAFLASGRPVFPSKLVQRGQGARGEVGAGARGAAGGRDAEGADAPRGAGHPDAGGVGAVVEAGSGGEAAREVEAVGGAAGRPGTRTASGPPGAYVLGGDPASGEENGTDAVTGRMVLAAHALAVIDHRTLRQVAAWASDTHDADEFADEALKAAVFFNRAWLAIERTGGWGLGPLRYIAREAHYARTYRTAPQDTAMPKDHEDRLGWSTDSATKPMMRDLGVQLLREGRDGIMDVDLATEMLTT
jgi:hypothetical protein